MSNLTFSQAMSAINRQLANVQNASEQGLIEASLMILATSQRKTPVRTGNLKGSIYHFKNESRGRTSVEAGFGQGANYAFAVHEATHIEFRNGQAKFLESTMTENLDSIVHVVANRARSAM